MKVVYILEKHDAVYPEDWCRPLQLETMSLQGDGYSFTSPYSGTPDNNVKWVRVKYIFGKCWYNKPVSDLCKLRPYEFVRGVVPDSHILNLEGYEIII
jgi:hypothetical protein